MKEKEIQIYYFCINFSFLVNNTKCKSIQKGWIDLKKIGIVIGVILIIALGMYIGFKISGDSQTNLAEDKESSIDNTKNIIQDNIQISSVETSVNDEKTTPNTIITYKTYYTKCKHYIQEYKDIDASLVNCTESELKEKCRNWNIEKFSSQEVEMSRDEEKFCNQHYKLKLENNVIVVYNVDENGIETEYEQTGITTEYLTEEDILRLKTGIIIYGKENLTSAIEDYE